MNRKASDKILSLYWFAILGITAGGIFLMVYIFYAHSYDVREAEADILANKIADCLSNAGRLNEQVIAYNIAEGELNQVFVDLFLEKCHLDFKPEDEEIQYYSEISFYTLENPNQQKFNFFVGNLNLKEDCGGTKVVKCVKKRFYAVDSKDINKQWLVEILSIVRKAEKNE